MGSAVGRSPVVDRKAGCPWKWIWTLVALMWAAGLPRCVAAEGERPSTLVAFGGEVHWQAAGQTNWVRFSSTNGVLSPGTRVRAGRNGWAMIRLPNECHYRMGPETIFVVQPPSRGGTVRQLLEKGLHYFFDRDKAGSLEVEVSGGSGVSQGTEFVVKVGDDGSAEFSMLDGVVLLANAQGKIRLESGGTGRIDRGGPPRRLGGLYSANAIQWCLYYPAVLVPGELVLGPGEAVALGPVLDLYRAGDVVGALAAWPAMPGVMSGPARSLHAQLLLGIGETEAARAELAGVDGPAAVDVATLLGAVTDPMGTPEPPDNGTGSRALALAYRAQGVHRLGAARAWARSAAARCPSAGFAWALLAELDFGFGDASGAADSNRRARTLAPKHAPAAALDGFVAAAGNHAREAMERFDEAIRLDPRLANGWLGRGLCRIRLGDVAGGLEDLTVAAAMEPNRSLLRSHLAKAWQLSRNPARAGQELGLARRLDPSDPTPSLYRALMAYDANRINEAIGNLEESMALNDNRAVFRSGLKLDEDRAVRGTGLARVYARAGMTDVALREAARAVAGDYSNYAAHLFLAETYDALRDPARFDLRYETAWFNELLLADLLAPVGAGTFSPNVSQQEYTRLFERETLGVSSVTEWRSDGRWHQIGTQSGFLGRTAWSFDVDYEHQAGTRPNTDLDRAEWYGRIKRQVTDADTVTLLAKVQDYSSGDNFRRLDPSESSPSFRYDESQHPILLGGWRHEWAPGVQTLLLGGRLENDQRFAQSNVVALELLSVPDAGIPNSFANDVVYRGRLEIQTVELNQLVATEHQTLVAGGRFQSGDSRVDYRLEPADRRLLDVYPGALGADRAGGGGIRRGSGYLYETWKPVASLALTAGIAYERLEAPADFRRPPLGGGQRIHERVEPKAALVWAVSTNVVVRGMYARSLGGVSLEQSYRLEPVQLAGFSQAFRTVIPESLAGSVTAPRFDVAGLALDTKWPGAWYAGIRFDWVRSRVEEGTGLFEFDLATQEARTAVRWLSYRYDERAVTLTVDKLVGQRWSFGASARGADARLTDSLETYASSHRHVSTTGEFGLRATWNDPGGWFAGSALRWEMQDWQVSGASGLDPRDPLLNYRRDGSEGVPFLDLRLGWRFPRNRAELSVGVLNLLDRDYRLDPLGGVPELSRSRVFTARLRFYF